MDKTPFVQTFIGAVLAPRSILSAAAVSLMLVAFAECDSKPLEVFEIPAGHVGWVEILTKRPACPPLRPVGETTVFVIPSDGRLCTSSQVRFGWGREQYYYVSPGSRTPLSDDPMDPQAMIWNVEYYGGDGFGPSHETQRDRVRFFVGSRLEYQSATSAPHSGS